MLKLDMAMKNWILITKYFLLHFTAQMPPVEQTQYSYRLSRCTFWNLKVILEKNKQSSYNQYTLPVQYASCLMINTF